MAEIEHWVSIGGQRKMLCFPPQDMPLFPFLLSVYGKAIYLILNWGASSDVTVIVMCIGDPFSWKLGMGLGSPWIPCGSWSSSAVTEEKLRLNDTIINAP